MARARRTDRPSAPAAPLSETVSAALLGEATRALARGGPWSVLDLGPASPATLRFFGELRCRLGVADAVAELAGLAATLPAGSPELPARLDPLLPPAAGRPWQVVLLWDLLDYLPTGMLERLGDALAPHLAPAALLHGFVGTAATPVPDPPAVYEIESAEQLRRHHAGGERAPARHTPWHIQRHLAGVAIERSRLHRDGRQEHLLRWPER